MTPSDAITLIEIDPLALDKEWLRQPGMYVSVSQQLAEARAQLDALKNQMTVIEADCDKRIRRDPGRYGIEKITEKAVAAEVVSHPKMKAAHIDFLDAKHEVDMLQGLLNAMEHRKEALKALTTLHLNSYYGSGPAAVSSEEARAITEASKGRNRAAGQTADLPKGKRKG